jgi:hypothetical protein
LPGDFNYDGKVDAADYVVWRKTGGNQASYTEWQSNFGHTSSGAASGQALSNGGAIPEPASAALLLLGVTFLAMRYRKTIAIVAILLITSYPCVASAATKYWDVNDSASGAGGPTPNGTWDTSTANWTTSSSGSSATTTWSTGDSAVFSAGSDATGAYTVTMSGAQTLSGLTVDDGTVVISGGANSLSLGANPARINQGATLQIPNFNVVSTSAVTCLRSMAELSAIQSSVSAAASGT